MSAPALARALLAVMLFAVAAGAAAADASHVLRVEHRVAQTTLDPQAAYDTYSFQVIDAIYDPLYTYAPGKTDVIPNLASCQPNTDGTQWICTLKQGVKFHDGADLDANDVVTSFAVQWDAKHPLHVGNLGTFDYFPALFGGFLNPPAS